MRADRERSGLNLRHVVRRLLRQRRRGRTGQSLRGQRQRICRPRRRREGSGRGSPYERRERVRRDDVARRARRRRQQFRIERLALRSDLHRQFDRRHFGRRLGRRRIRRRGRRREYRAGARIDGGRQVARRVACDSRRVGRLRRQRRRRFLKPALARLQQNVHGHERQGAEDRGNFCQRRFHRIDRKTRPGPLSNYAM